MELSKKHIEHQSHQAEHTGPGFDSCIDLFARAGRYQMTFQKYPRVS